MARSITLDREETTTGFGLARREDVNYDDIKKRWRESADKMDLPQDNRTAEEIQAAEDFSGAASFAEFFGYEDVEINEVNAQEVMEKMASEMEAVSEEEFKIANDIREKVIEEDAAEQIEQVSAFVVNEDDPLLEADFKEKSERIIQKLVVEDSKKDGTYESIREEARKTHSTSDPWSGTSGTRSTTATSTTTRSSSTTVFQDNDQRKKEVYEMYANGHDNMLGFVHNGRMWEKPKKTASVNTFSGRRKFGLKSMWQSTKHWFHSPNAKLMCKVGIALCMEMALGIITQKQTFDGPKQMLGYLGMMLGIFYIGAELRAEGFDMRRLSAL